MGHLQSRSINFDQKVHSYFLPKDSSRNQEANWNREMRVKERNTLSLRIFYGLFYFLSMKIKIEVHEKFHSKDHWRLHGYDGNSWRWTSWVGFILWKFKRKTQKTFSDFINPTHLVHLQELTSYPCNLQWSLAIYYFLLLFLPLIVPKFTSEGLNDT